jgi:hypothetical protein
VEILVLLLGQIIYPLWTSTPLICKADRSVEGNLGKTLLALSREDFRMDNALMLR